MDRAAILACLIIVAGVVMYAAPPNQVSEEAPAASCSPRLAKVIVSVDVAVGSFSDIAGFSGHVRFAFNHGRRQDIL